MDKIGKMKLTSIIFGAIGIITFILLLLAIFGVI